MNTIEYISDFLRYPMTEVDLMDLELVRLVMEGYTSSYSIWSLLKKDAKNNDGRAMAYKNVNRRITRLYKSGILEEIALGSTNIHGRKDYRISSKGLIYYFREYSVPYDSGKIAHSHPNNVMFKVFVYPFFERETLRDSSYNLSRLLGSYLEEVSALTRYWLSPMFLEAYDYDITKSLTEQGFSIETLPPVMILELELNSAIASFLFRVTIMKKELIWWRGIESYHQDEEKERLKTMRQLACDKKFMHALKQAERDFRKGYEKLIELEATERRARIP